MVSGQIQWRRARSFSNNPTLEPQLAALPLTQDRRLAKKNSAVARRALLLSAALGAVAVTHAQALGDVYANNGGTSLDLATSWTDLTSPATTSAPPSAGDIARWDSLSTGGAFNLDINTTWLGISILNPGAAVTIGGASDIAAGAGLTLGASGIDMSSATQNLTIADTLALSANQTWTVGGTQTFSLSNTLNLNAVTLTIAGNNVSLNNAAAVVSGSGNLVKNGAGTLTLGALNTYTGFTTVNNGTLVLQMATATPTSNSPPADNVSILNAGGGTISSIGGARLSGSTNPAYIANIGTMNAVAGATTFLEARGASSRVIVTLNNYNRSAGATVNLTDTLNAAGTNNANSGGYRANSTAYSSATNTGNVVNGVVPYMTYTTTTSGTTPTAPLVANNPLASSWFVPAGTGANGTAYSAFTASTLTTLGTATQNVDVVTSVTVPTASTVNTLRFNSGNSNTLTIASGDTLVVGAGGVLITGAYANHQARISGGTLEGGNPGSGSGNDLIFIDFADPGSGTNARTTIDSVIADNSGNGNTNGTATALTKSGIGILALTNTANTYTGGTFLNGGTINIAGEGSSTGSLGAIPATPSANNLTFSGGSLQFASSFNLNANRGITLSDKGGTLDTNGFSTTYSGLVTGSGSLTKLNSGTLRLTSANTFTGGFNVASGTLSVVNTTGSATGTGNGTVGAGAFLTGNGKISGAVSLAGSATNGSGGRIDPGDLGVGSITLGSLSMVAGSAADIELSNNASYDQIIATNLTLSGGGINLYQPGSTVLPFSSNGTHTYNLFSYTGAISGSPSNLVILNPVSGFTYTFGSTSPSGPTPGFVTLTTSGTAVGVVSQWNTAVNNQPWSNAANWTAGVPHSAGDIASFFAVSGQTGPIAVNLDASETVGSINFNNAFSYTITATNGSVLTLDAGGGGNASINDLAGVHTITSPMTLNSNTTITTGVATDQLTLNGNITGSGNLTIGSSAAGTFGTVVLTGTNSYADPTTINAGNTLQLGSAAISTTGSLGGTNLVDNGTFVINRSNAYTLAGNITGTGSLVQSGAGVFTLSGTNTYSGATAINAGTLQLGTAGSLGTGAVTVAAGALLDINGFNTSIGSLAGAGTVDNVSAGGTPVVTIGSANGTTTFSGVIKNTTGTISLVKAGTGNATLSGVNTYTGSTAVGAVGTTAPAAGTLTVTGTIGGGPTQAAFAVGDNASLAVNGGTIIATTFSADSAINTVVSVTNNGAITVAGNLAIDNNNQNGTGYLSLTSGTVTANSATIGRTSTVNSALVTGGVSTTSGIYVNGGTLNVATTLGIGNSTATNSSANMRVDAGSVTVGGTTTVTNNQGSSPGRYTVLDLSGGTFTSNDTAGAGIQVGGNFATPYAELLVRNTATLNANTITLGNANQTGGVIVLELIGGTTYLGSGGIVTGGSSVTPAVNFGATAVATSPILAANAPWSSSVAITLNNSSSGLLPTVKASNASGGAEAITLSGSLSGGGGLNKSGAGMLTLSGSNNYGGGTNISAGTIIFASPAALPTFSKLFVNTGAQATAAGHGTNPRNTLFVSSLSIAGATDAWTGRVDLNDNAMLIQNGDIAMVTNQVKQGYNSGTWNGSGGFVSTSAAQNSSHLTALGAIQNSIDGSTGGTALFNNFDGQGTFSTDVLLKYTYYGDADLSGTVDGSDYSRIDAAFANNRNNGNAPLTGWFNGDFNYDGSIDGSDYTLIDNAFNSQGANIASAVTAAQVAKASAVPEPASLGLIGLAAAGLLGRRRK